MKAQIRATDVLGSNSCIICSTHVQLAGQCQQFPSAVPCQCQLSRTWGCVWGGALFGVSYGHLLLSSQHCLPPTPVSTDATSLLGLSSSDEPKSSELPCCGSSTPQAPANGFAPSRASSANTCVLLQLTLISTFLLVFQALLPHPRQVG